MRSLGGNLIEQIANIENLKAAHKAAKRGKSHYKDVKMVDKDPDKLLQDLSKSILDGSFKTSEYIVEVRFTGGKERVIHKLPYYPDRVVQHAIVNICKDFWISKMIKNTYQSIPGRGVHLAARDVRKAVKDPGTRYAVKLDIEKFYPSIKNEYLLDTKVLGIRCRRTRELLKDIITSLPELPLGNHTSQYMGNLLLTPLDWYCKQSLGIKKYFRYCDDILILSNDLGSLKEWEKSIADQLSKVGLSLKHPGTPIDLYESNINFLGFLIKKDRLKIRKSILHNFINACINNKIKSIPSYYGWFKHSKALNTFHRYVGKLKCW